jgi:hypothetical protein
MRHIRITFGLAVTVCALAVMAVPAMAHQFVASGVGTTNGKGFEQIKTPPGELPEFEPSRMQEFKFGNFKILCYGASSKGTITEPVSETFTTTTKYSKCGWYPQSNSLHSAATFSKEGVTVTYHANGYLEAEANESGEEVEVRTVGLKKVSASIKVGQKICDIIIPEQTVPVRAIRHPTEEFSSAVFPVPYEVASTNHMKFPSGFQKRLKIENAWKMVKFIYGGEGNQCTAEEFEKLGEGGGGIGQYNGTLEEQLVGGNLQFE